MVYNTKKNNGKLHANQNDETKTWDIIKTSTGKPRISQACDRCCIKKIKCDGMPGGCSNCKKVGFFCKTTNKLSRASFPRNYTKTLEKQVVELELENNRIRLELENLQKTANVSTAAKLDKFGNDSISAPKKLLDTLDSAHSADKQDKLNSACVQSNKCTQCIDGTHGTALDTNIHSCATTNNNNDNNNFKPTTPIPRQVFKISPKTGSLVIGQERKSPLYDILKFVDVNLYQHQYENNQQYQKKKQVETLKFSQDDCDLNVDYNLLLFNYIKPLLKKRNDDDTIAISSDNNNNNKVSGFNVTVLNGMDSLIAKFFNNFNKFIPILDFKNYYNDYLNFFNKYDIETQTYFDDFDTVAKLFIAKTLIMMKFSFNCTSVYDSSLAKEEDNHNDNINNRDYKFLGIQFFKKISATIDFTKPSVAKLEYLLLLLHYLYTFELPRSNYKVNYIETTESLDEWIFQLVSMSLSYINCLGLNINSDYLEYASDNTETMTTGSIGEIENNPKEATEVIDLKTSETLATQDIGALNTVKREEDQEDENSKQKLESPSVSASLELEQNGNNNKVKMELQDTFVRLKLYWSFKILYHLIKINCNYRFSTLSLTFDITDNLSLENSWLEPSSLETVKVLQEELVFTLEYIKLLKIIPSDFNDLIDQWYNNTEESFPIFLQTIDERLASWKQKFDSLVEKLLKDDDDKKIKENNGILINQLNACYLMYRMSIYFKFTKNCIKPEFVTKKDNTVNNIKNNSKLQVLSQLSMEYIQLGIDTLTRMTKHEFKKRATRGRKRKNPLPQTPLEEDENKFNKDQTEISVEKLSINKKFLIVDRLSLLPYDFKIYLLLACLNYLALDDSNENNSCTNNGKEQPSDDVLKTKSIISKIVVMFEVSFGNLDALIKGLTSATRKLLEWRSNNVVDVMKELEDIHTSFTCNSIVGSGSNYCNNNQDGFLLSMGLDDSHSSSGAAGSSTDDTDLNCFTELSSPSSNNISPHMVDLSFQPSSKRQRSVSCVTPTPVSAVSSSASSVGTNCSKTTETTSGNSLFSSIQANRMSRASSCASNSSNSTSTYNNSMMMSRGSSINRRSSSISTTATSTSMAMKRGNSSMSNSNPPSSLIPNSLPASYRTGSLFANHKPNPNMNRNSQSQFNGYDNCYYPKNGSSISGSVDTDHINTFLDTFTHNDGNHNQKTNYNIRRKGDTHEVSSLTANTASDIYDVDMDIMDLEVSNLTTTNVENNASANKDFNYFNEFFKWNGTTSNGATTPNGKLGSGTNIANIADMCAFQTSLDPLAPASNGQKLNGASSLQKDNDDLMRLKEKVLSLKSSRGDSEWD